ncbi:MAG TPA: hypothetical protein VGY76_11900 [Solirubrobacteraceae bacterium]|jgi:hypothetical protein|nr:hypothetical protein [Solirubrobacteraceae bacterium]
MLRAEIAPTVQKGALIELELASHEISTLSESPSEATRDEYEATYPYLMAALAFLSDVGYPSDPPVDVEVDLTRHLWMLIRTLKSQQRANMELMDDRDPDERPAAKRQIQLLGELIKAALCES